MNKEVIAVDIDEVLFPFVEHFVLHDREHHGSQVELADFSSYAFEDVLNISMEEAVERVYHFNDADHDHIAPLESSVDAIEELAERFEVVAITARHPQFETHTRRWLDKHVGSFVTDLTCVGYAKVMENPRKKVDVCHELGAVALIDDSIAHVSECAQAGLEGVLFGNYPWNQAMELPAGVTRCENWPAVLEYFDARG